MKKITTIMTVVLLIALVFTSCSKFSGTDMNTIVPEEFNTEYIQCGEYEVVANRLLVGYETTDALNTLAGKLNANILFTIPQIKAAALNIPGDVAETIKVLSAKSIEGIKYVEPSYKRELIQPDVVDLELIESRASYDPFFDYLWGVKKINAE